MMPLLKRLTILAAILSLAGACAPAANVPASLATPSPGGADVPMTTATLVRPAGRTPTPRPTQKRLSATATLAEGTMKIEVGDYYFSPQVLTVTVGTTVIWVGVGSLFHTIVPVDPPDVWRNGVTAGLGSPNFQYTFRRPGTYKYTCDYHPAMMDAWIVVVESQ